MNKPEYDALEELLRRSDPRPVPSSAELAAAKAAVRQDWHAVTGTRRRRQRMRTLAIAATVLIGVFAAWNAWRAPVPEPVPVAAVAKQFGDVFVLDEQATLQPAGALTGIESGQMVVTGRDAGLALSWGGGGSLRIGDNTRIRFTDTATAFLEEGRIYFDSVQGLSAPNHAEDSPAFTLATQHGNVRHVGTQYMVEADAQRLVVSVREGEVVVDGSFHKPHVAMGEQATLSGSRRPSVLSISRFGEYWDWVSDTTPPADMHGRSLHEFLAWASRELGLEFRLEGGAAAIAHEPMLMGTVDTPPMDALRVRLASAALVWRIDEGVIYISD